MWMECACFCVCVGNDDGRCGCCVSTIIENSEGEGFDVVVVAKRGFTSGKQQHTIIILSA